MLQDRTEHDVEDEADGHTRQGGDGRFDRRHHRHLPGRSACQAYRGEALFATCRSKPGRGSDEDEYWEQQRQRPYGEDGRQSRGVVASWAVVAGRRGDAGHHPGSRYAGELARVLTDDDDQ